LYQLTESGLAGWLHPNLVTASYQDS
jgi:hypothetical protein